MKDLQSIKDMNNGVKSYKDPITVSHTYMSKHISLAENWVRLLAFLKTCPDMPIVSYTEPRGPVEHTYNSIVDRLVMVLQHGSSTEYITTAEGLRGKVEELIEREVEIPSILYGC